MLVLHRTHISEDSDDKKEHIILHDLLSKG